MGKRAKQRLKVLKAARRAAHRYDRLRALGMTASLGTLFVVPLTGAARVDLWRGNHYLLFERMSLRHALAGVIVGIAVMYVVTFLSNVLAGRMFCGWGCPVGQQSRFGELADSPGFSARQRRVASLKGAAFGLLFFLSMMAWWVDLRVFWQAPALDTIVVWSILLAGGLTAWAHGRWWRWEFCKTVCPIGLYYTFVSPAKWYGVYFRNQQESCIECNLCDHVCPVDLAPRDLLQPIPARGGVSIDEAPGRNHCLECGDCVRACEWIIETKGDGPVPLLLGHYSGPQRIEAPDPAKRAQA